MSSAQSRNSNIDALRVIAALGVVFIHAASSAETFPFALINAITRFSVPVFFMISGYFMLNKEYSVKRILSKSVRLLLLMLGWSTVYCIVNTLTNPPQAFSAIGTLKEILLGPVHFWYFYAAIAVYLITPLLSVFCRNADKQTYRYILVLLFILGCVVNIILMTSLFPTLEEILQKAKFSPQTGFVFCYLLGGYVNRFSLSSHERSASVFSGLVGVVISLSAILLLNTYFPEYSNIAISFFSPAVMASAVMIFCAAEHTDKFSKIAVLAPYTLGIYILHILVLTYISQPLFSFMQYKGFLYVTANALFTFAVSLLCSYILKKIPFTKKLI